jgi:hypothetical protein
MPSELRVPTPESLLEHILDALRLQCAFLAQGKWEPLGQPLLGQLRRLGREAGCRVWDKGGEGEHLWDVAWTRERDQVYGLEFAAELDLAGEGRTAIEDDLYKVLDAKAPLKLFVAAASRTLAQGLQGEIDWAVAHQRYCLPEERLVAVLLTTDEHETYQATVQIFGPSGPAPGREARWTSAVLTRGR